MVGNHSVLLRYFNPISCFLIILVLVYAAVSKLADFNTFKEQMHMQLFNLHIIAALIYGLPLCEIIIAGLIAFEHTRFKGLLCGLILFLAFTVYVGIAAFHLLPKRPCSCGGILSHMGWMAHFYFNLIFLILITTNILTLKRKEALAKK